MFNTCKTALKPVICLFFPFWGKVQCDIKRVTVRYERIQKKKQVKKKLLIRFVMLTNGLLISELMHICFSSPRKRRKRNVKVCLIVKHPHLYSTESDMANEDREKDMQL